MYYVLRCICLDGVNWAAHVTVLPPTCNKSEATHIIHKPAGTGVKLTDIDAKDLDNSRYFLDNFDDMKVALTNGKHLKVSLFEIIAEIDYYQHMDKEISKHYGNDEWKQNFGSEMTTTRKAAKGDFAAKKEELVAATKEAGVDIANTPAKKRRVRG